MTATLIIAILGLTLGVINTSTTVYKEFIKKPPTPFLDVHIDSALWRYHGPDKTESQVILDVTVTPRIQANSIKKIVFINKEHQEVFGAWGEERNHATFYKIFENIHGENLFSKHKFEELKKALEKNQEENQRDVRNINLPLDFSYSFTLAEKFDGFRYPDGYEDIPLSGWYLQVFDSNNTCFEKPIYFQNSTKKEHR